MRKAIISRNTSETKIIVELDLDNSTTAEINTGIGFFDHMLELFAFRACIGLCVKCDGDLHIDGHHTVEDVGIALGQALSQALGDKAGINRYGQAFVPMDECLARCVLDISGRAFLAYDATLSATQLGNFETELTEEFFRAVATHAGITLHICAEYGRNTHHIIEALFKAFGVALRQAVQVVGTGIPSTKGIL